MNAFRSICFSLTLAFASIPISVAVAQSNDRVMQEALSPSNPLQENLRKLADEIGGRIPGTPAFEQATQWAVDAFKLPAPTRFTRKNSPSQSLGRRATPRSTWLLL